AEVTISATPTADDSSVKLLAPADTVLRETFGPDADFLTGSCIIAGIRAQRGSASVAREMPRAQQSAFTVQVIGIRVSGNAGRERSGFLLTVAAMDAIGKFLVAYESSVQIGVGSE